MLGVLVEFRYTDGFDHDRIVEIARRARTSFEGMPGLRQKTFTVDEQNRRAVNFLGLGERRGGARVLRRGARRARHRADGVRPTVTFVEIAELVDNG